MKVRPLLLRCRECEATEVESECGSERVRESPLLVCLLHSTKNYTRECQGELLKRRKAIELTNRGSL